MHKDSRTSTASAISSTDHLERMLPVCSRQIAAVRRRFVISRRLAAISVFAAALLAGGMGMVLLDILTRGPVVLRFLLLAGWMAIAAAAVIRGLLPRWAGLSVDRAAVLIERTHSFMAGRLVTSVQLALPQQRRASGASDGLFEDVCQHAERKADSISPVRAWPIKHHVRFIAALWLVALLPILLAAVNPTLASIGLRRIVRPWQSINYPQKTQILLAQHLEDNGPIVVVRGGTFVVEGQVEGEIPRTGLLHIETSQQASDRAYFEIEPDGRFQVPYRPVMQDLTVWLEVGDARTRKLHVNMALPPEVSGIRTVCEYPEYTGLESQTVEDGNIQAIFRTKAKVHVKASKPLESARIVWNDGSVIPMTLQGEDSAEADFVVSKTHEYTVQLTDTMSFHNDEPVVYRVQMIDNEYPQIHSVKPASDKRITPEAVVPIEAVVTDDFGVTQVVLSWQIDDTIQRQPLPLSSGNTRIETLYPWDIEPLQLSAGDQILYWIEARDEGEHANERDWPASRPHRLTVMDEVELARLLSEEMEQVMDRLSKLEGMQQECADAVARLAERVAQADISENTQLIERARAEKWRQDRIVRTAAQLANRLEQIVRDYEISQLGQQTRRQRLRQTAEELAQLASTGMPGVVLALDEALATLQDRALSNQETGAP